MATDFTILLENRPGTLADVGEAAGRAGVDLRAVTGFPCEGRGVLHVVVDDAAGAREAFRDAGLEVSDERDVLLVDVADGPGAFGSVMRRFADNGANVDLVYVTHDGRLVVGGGDMEALRGSL